MNLNVFDDKVPYDVRTFIWNNSTHSYFKLGWQDTSDAETDKYELNTHWELPIDALKTIGIMPYFEQCIEDTEWFKDKNLYKVILNLVRSDDVHYIHHHDNQYVLLYYVNLEWRDGWHGETLFYDQYDNDKISFASPYKPGRIILFDGSIPHAIRPQSIKGPKFRFSLSLFFQ